MPEVGSISLGGVDLNNSLQWNNRYQWSPAQQNVRSTLLGNQVIYQQVVTVGRPIDLEATDTTGWLTKAMVDSLLALAEEPSVTRTLVFHGESYQVKFKYEENQSPVAFVPIRTKQVLSPEDWMVGTIKLFTV